MPTKESLICSIMNSLTMDATLLSKAIIFLYKPYFFFYKPKQFVYPQKRIFQSATTGEFCRKQNT